MDRDSVLMLREVIALQAEMYGAVAVMESMRAANSVRSDQGYSQEYGEESFDEISRTMDGIAARLRTIGGEV